MYSTLSAGEQVQGLEKKEYRMLPNDGTLGSRMGIYS